MEGAYEAVLALKKSAGLYSKPSWSKGTMLSCAVKEVSVINCTTAEDQ